MRKRICSLLVALVMLFSITATMCLPASAATVETYNGLKFCAQYAVPSRQIL